MQSQPPAHVPVLQLVQRIWPLVLVVVVLVVMASGSLYLVSAVRAFVAGESDPASFPRTPSHAAKRAFSQVTGGRKPLAECRRWRLYQPSIQSTMSSLACARVS